MTLSVSDLRLLEHWAPVRPDTGLPAWRAEAVRHKTRTAAEWPWDSTPSPREVAGCGAYPETFPGAGPDGRRYPVAVGPLTGDVRALLATVVDPGGSTRLERLLDHVADGLVAGDADVLLVTVSDQPDGEPVTGEVHVLRRDRYGNVLRAALAPGGAGQPAPTFDERVHCLTGMLSEMLVLNNTTSMSLFVDVRPHLLTLDPADPDTVDAAVEEWWSTAEFWEGEDEWVESDTAFTRVADPAALIADLEEEFRYVAGGSLTTVDDPDLPVDHLVTWLARDLFDTVFHEVGDPVAVYSVNLPDESPDDGYGYVGYLVVAGPARVGVITVNAKV